jgi:hypothetical protein
LGSRRSPSGTWRSPTATTAAPRPIAAEIERFRDLAGPDGRFAAGAPELRLEQIAAELANVRVAADESDPALKVDRLTLAGGEFDLAAGRLRHRASGLRTGRSIWSATGRVRSTWPSCWRPRGRGGAPQAEESAQEGSPWQFASQTIDLSGFSVAIRDQTVKPEGALVNLDPLNVTLTGVDGNSPTAFAVDLKVRQGGTVTVQGSADPSKKRWTPRSGWWTWRCPPFSPTSIRWSG